jgi:hypothetical protein
VCSPNKLISLLEATGVAWEKFVHHLCHLGFQTTTPAILFSIELCYRWTRVAAIFLSFFDCVQSDERRLESAVRAYKLMQLASSVRLSHGIWAEKYRLEVKRGEAMTKRDVNSRHFHESANGQKCWFKFPFFPPKVAANVGISSPKFVKTERAALALLVCRGAWSWTRYANSFGSSRRAAFGTKAGHDRHRTCFPSHT